MWYFLAVCIQAKVGVLWVVLLFDVEQGQVEALKHAEQRCTSHRIYMCNNYYTSSNHRLGSAGLNALEELLFRCFESVTEKLALLSILTS